jgi:multiple sugar transport system permease protein
VSAAIPDPAARRRRGGGGASLSQRDALLLIIPALLPVVILSVIPLARGVYLGFTDSQAGLGLPTHFTGLANLGRAWNDQLFVESFKIGLIWAFSVTAIQFVLALGLAMLLTTTMRLRWLARSLALVPWAMPPVIVGIMWTLVYQQQAGLLNEVLRRLHGPFQDTAWLQSFTYALPAVIVVGVWAGMPQTSVALLAALQTLPEELNEAAAVDGAGGLRRFRHVTLPHLKGVIIAITSLDFVWNFNSFGIIYVMTQGGPGGKTQVPAVFAYDEAFKYGQFGYASALGLVMVAVMAAILGFYLWTRSRETAS